MGITVTSENVDINWIVYTKRGSTHAFLEESKMLEFIETLREEGANPPVKVEKHIIETTTIGE